METLELMDRATLLSLPPVSPDCAAEVVEGTCESDPDYVKAICNNNNTICGRSLINLKEILINLNRNKTYFLSRKGQYVPRQR